MPQSSLFFQHSVYKGNIAIDSIPRPLLASTQIDGERINFGAI